MKFWTWNRVAESPTEGFLERDGSVMPISL